MCSPLSSTDFALLNGVIYIHRVLLARLDNEAQLATLLGHETTHATIATRSGNSGTRFKAASFSTSSSSGLSSIVP